MKTNKITTAFEIFSQLASQGKTLEAIEQFYANNIVQVENHTQLLEGKDFLYKHEKANLSKVSGLTMEFKQVVIDEDKGIVWGELHNHFTSKKHGPMLLREAFYQEWQEGKITLQKFYYHKVEPNNKGSKTSKN